jgi:hypothetical protein
MSGALSSCCYTKQVYHFSTCLFIRVLFNDSVSIVDNIAPNGGMIYEYIGKDLEVSDHDLIQGTVMAFAWRN